MTGFENSDGTDQPSRTRRTLLKAAAGAGAAASTGAAGCVSITTPADVAASSDLGGNIGYFVGPSTLAQRREEVVALDARSREAYREQRVYGARHVPLEDFTATRDTPAGSVPDTASIAAALGQLGVSPQDDVVVYGSSVGSRVTRTAFALEACGHAGEVMLLNGGFDAWNGRVGTGSSPTRTPVSHDGTARQDLWVTAEWLTDQIGEFNADGPGLVDVRQPDTYLGATSSETPPTATDRQGHLPGAINVHWLGNVAGRQLPDPGELYTLYTSQAELDTDRPVVVYGGENVDPTSTWLVLRAIGFDDVRLYDGGFSEWANLDDRGRFPVETATQVVIETDGEVGGGTDGGDFSCTG